MFSKKRIAIFPIHNKNQSVLILNNAKNTNYEFIKKDKNHYMAILTDIISEYLY